MPLKAQLGWFGVLDHFSFSCFFGRVTSELRPAMRRDRTEGLVLGRTLQCLGTPLAPPAPGADTVALSNRSHASCAPHQRVPCWPWGAAGGCPCSQLSSPLVVVLSER